MNYAIVILGLLLGCGGKSKQECRVEAEAVGTLLVEAAKEPFVFLSLRDGVRVVTRTDLDARRDLRAGPVVTLTPTQVAFADYTRSYGEPAEQALADVAALATPLRDAFAAMQEDLASGKVPARWSPDPHRVYFVIDPATPWSLVVAAVDVAKSAGLTAPAFVFEQPTSIKPPPPSGIGTKLDAIVKDEPSDRAMHVAMLMQEVIKNCPPLIKSFGAVGGDEPADKAMNLSLDVAPSLIACDCNVNIPDLRTVMLSIIHVARPVRVITLDAAATADRIALPPTTTWAEASKRFTPALKNATLAL